MFDIMINRQETNFLFLFARHGAQNRRNFNKLIVHFYLNLLPAAPTSLEFNYGDDMHIKIKKILILAVLMFFSVFSYAGQLLECDSCSYRDMKNKAKYLIDSGIIAFYDPTDREAYKFLSNDF